MSCNNYQPYYYCSYPSTYSNYNKNYSCGTQCYCKVKCNPCQTIVCQPQYTQQQCVVACPTPCPTPCPPVCPTPCTPVCPNVTFISGIATATSVPAGGTFIPVGTTIPAGTTTVPAGTVTVITGITGTPTTNIGGITQNNGFFTMPVAGRYILVANVCFTSVTTTTSTDVRVLYLYKVAADTGLVTLLSVDSRGPIAGSPTCINLAGEDNFAAGDRVFIAATQTNATGAVVDTVAGTGRISITRIC